MTTQNPGFDIVLPPVSAPITSALQELADKLRQACPPGALISFRFDSKLHADIDTRSVEEARTVEHALLKIDEVVFDAIRPAKSPGAFLHRVTAEVAA